jgi:hypothetical protein
MTLTRINAAGAAKASSILRTLLDDMLINGRRGSIVNCKYTETPDDHLGVDDTTHNRTYLFMNRAARLDFRGVINRVKINLGELDDVDQIRLCVTRFSYSTDDYAAYRFRVISTSQWFAAGGLAENAENDFTSITWSWGLAEHWHDCGDFLGIEIDGKATADSTTDILPVDTGLTASWYDCRYVSTLPDAGTVTEWSSTGATGKSPRFTVYSNIPHLVMFGDSISLGSDSANPRWDAFANVGPSLTPSSWDPWHSPAKWIAEGTGLDTGIIGMGGTSRTDWNPPSATYWARVAACTPMSAALVLGTNDILNQAGAGEALLDFTNKLFGGMGEDGVFPTLKTMGCRGIMVSVPPLAKIFGIWTNLDLLHHEIRAWNAVLKRKCRDQGIPFADPWRGLASPYDPRQTGPPLVTLDTHPSVAGYKVLAEAVIDAMKEI